MKQLRQLALALILGDRLVSAVQAQTAAGLHFWAAHYRAVRAVQGVYIVTTHQGKMGLLDARGRALTRPEYDTIFDFLEQIAIVGKGDR